MRADAEIAVDPVVLEIVEGTVNSTVAEIELAIERTSMSSMIREQHDFRAAIYDGCRNAISHVSFPSTIEPIFHRYRTQDIHDGDVFVYNDVYLTDGGISHLPDLCVNVPVVLEERVVAFVQSFGHVEDVGGIVPGSLPVASRSIFEEGLMVPPVRVISRDEPNTEVLDLILRNSRYPTSLKVDIYAQIAACRMGARRLAGLFGRYGWKTIEACFDALLTRCKNTLRREVLPKISDGHYEFEDFVGFDGVTEGRHYRIHLALTKSADKLRIDLSRSDVQAAGPINFLASEKIYKKLFAAALVPLAPDMLLNDGVGAVLDVTLPPPGSILNPRFPAPVAQRTVTWLRMLDAFQGALAQALRGQVAAAMDTITVYGMWGSTPSGSDFLLREIIGGGTGGRAFADGLDAVDMIPGSKNLPVEYVEDLYPVRVERVALRRDSGGAGKQRGGMGYEKDVRVLAPTATLYVRACRSFFWNWGVGGGRAGKPTQFVVNPGSAEERVLPPLIQGVTLKAGDLLRVLTAGGGGWGDPLDRDPRLVERDVAAGVVSVEAAEREYGVCLTPETLELVPEMTERTRAKLRVARGALPLVDRGPYARELVEQGRLHLSA